MTAETEQLTFEQSDAVGAVRDLIGAIPVPVDPAAEKSVRELIHTAAASLHLQWTQLVWENAERSRSALAFAHAQLAEARLRLDHALNELTHSTTHTLRLLLSLLAVAICSGAEFALTLVCLPYALDIKPQSWSALALSAVPVAALCALEYVVGSFLAPYATAERSTRTKAGLAVFLVALAALNIGGILLIAEARAEAANERKVLERQSHPEIVDQTALPKVNEETIRWAVVGVSVLAAVDGALLFTCFLADFRSLSRRLAARRKVGKSELEISTLGKRLTTLEALFRSWERVWLERESFGKGIEDEVMAYLSTKLALRLAEKRSAPATPSLGEIVDSILNSPRKASRVM
jgi:hypothetical protein